MRALTTRAMAALVCGALPGLAACQEPQASNIAQHMPSEQQFGRQLDRDLRTFFAAEGMSEPRVAYELLRDGPTQTGIAYPKYYAWVEVTAADGQTTSGAVRVAAIEGTRFEVTNYVSRSEILAEPSLLDPIFPATLIPSIRTKAADR